MERQIEEEFFRAPAQESDTWIRFLEANGAVTPLGGRDDPWKVIAIPESLWRRGGLADRSRPHGVSHPTVGSSAQSIHRRSASDHLRPPAEFIEELKRRHFRERATAIRVGNLSVPLDLKSIVDRIRESQSALQSSEAEPEDVESYQMETLTRVARFVLSASIEYWRSRNTVPPTPVISGGPDGSIDVVWRGRKRTLYLNVPESPDNVVTFFGTDQEHPHLRLRGEEDPHGKSDWLLTWLVR